MPPLSLQAACSLVVKSSKKKEAETRTSSSSRAQGNQQQPLGTLAVRAWLQQVAKEHKSKQLQSGKKIQVKKATNKKMAQQCKRLLDPFYAISNTYQQLSYPAKLYFWHLRRRYPKIPLEPATSNHPAGPSTLDECFTWPGTFLEALGQHYGTELMSKQLSRWRWNVTTCFSGVGCAETVRPFVLNLLRIETFSTATYT